MANETAEHSHLRGRRAGHKKSRNGCLTCKIRRIKCDETKPHCRRCTETGRKCEGPIGPSFRFVDDQPISQPSTPAPQKEVSLLVPQHHHDERRAFDYFMFRAGPVFVAAVDASFWKGLVPQLAQKYDFVWDTVVGLASMLEHVPYTSSTATEGRSSPIDVINQGHQKALKWYSRAIANVRELADRGGIDDSVVILSCIMFATMEFQQHNIKTGNDLLIRCCTMLSKSLTSASPRDESAAGKAVHQVIAPFVLRKGVLISTLGNVLPPEWDNDDDMSFRLKAALSRSPELDKARIEFHRLMQDSYNIIRLADFVPTRGDDNPVKVSFFSTRQSLLEKLVQWREAFSPAIDQSFDQETNWIRSHLLMYWAVCYISLATCITFRQIIFDDYNFQFAEVIKHAEDFLEYGHNITRNEAPFPFDPGVIPALYFCGIKCRDPILRRRALRLMRQLRHEENLWAFAAPAAVVARVIAVEEEQSRIPPETDDPRTGCTSPPEKSRFAYVGVVGREAAGGKWQLALELCRFEFAGEFRKLVTEYSWLEDQAVC